MKVKTIAPFRDKTDGLRLREVGKTFEVEDARGKELIEKGLVEVADAPAEAPKKKAAKKPAPKKAD